LNIVGRRVGSCPQGVVDVDGVFRQDGDEGEAGQRDSLGDVRFGGLGAPRQEEAGPEDQEPEDGDRQDRWWVDACEPEGQGRHGRAKGDDHAEGESTKG